MTSRLVPIWDIQRGTELECSFRGQFPRAREFFLGIAQQAKNGSVRFEVRREGFPPSWGTGVWTSPWVKPNHELPVLIPEGTTDFDLAERAPKAGVGPEPNLALLPPVRWPRNLADQDWRRLEDMLRALSGAVNNRLQFPRAADIEFYDKAGLLALGMFGFSDGSPYPENYIEAAIFVWEKQADAGNPPLWARIYNDSPESFRDFKSRIRTSPLGSQAIMDADHIWIPLQVDLELTQQQRVEDVLRQWADIKEILLPGLSKPAPRRVAVDGDA